MRIEEITEAMQAIVDAAEAETRSLTDEEVTQYEGLEADLKAAQKSSEIRSRQGAYMATAPAVITATPKGDAALEFAFESYLRTGQRNSDLTELRSQQGLSNAEGGYTVPEGFRSKLIEVRKDFGGIRSVAEVITTATGNPLPWPTNDDTANLGEIVAEHNTIASGDDFVFGTHALGAYKFMAGGASNTPVRVSVELLQDSDFDIAGFVARKLGERIARSSAYYYAIGQDSTEPGGLFYTTADVQTPSGGALSYATLLDLIHDVDPAYRNGASFVMNDGTLKKVRQIVDLDGRPVWTPASAAGMTTLPGGDLLGYPVIIDQNAPAWSATASDKVSGTPVAGEGYMAFGNIKEAFVIRDVKDITLVVDPFGRAANGQVQFIAWARGDSTIQQRAAYAVLQGYHA